MAIDRSKQSNRPTSRGNRIHVWMPIQLAEELQWLADINHHGNRSAMVSELVRAAVEKQIKRGSELKRPRARARA